MSSSQRDYQEYLDSLGFAPQAWIPEPTSIAAPSLTSPAPATEAAWEALRAPCLVCTKCKLSTTRTHVVFGTGNRQARLMFVGEGPGADEDQQGEPFVGKAGQLLTRMIEAMKLRRDDVYIANVVKCRPPNNRNPEPDEIAECLPYLARQIELVQPEIIVGLGSFAAKTLLTTELAISRLRGKFHPLPAFKNRAGEPVQMMPTFHPAYLLRNPEMKKPVWDDLKLVIERLN